MQDNGFHWLLSLSVRIPSARRCAVNLEMTQAERTNIAPRPRTGACRYGCEIFEHDPLPTLEMVVRVGFLSAEGLGRPLLGAVGADAGRAAWGLSDAVETVTAMSSFSCPRNRATAVASSMLLGIDPCPSGLGQASSGAANVGP